MNNKRLIRKMEKLDKIMDKCLPDDPAFKKARKKKIELMKELIGKDVVIETEYQAWKNRVEVVSMDGERILKGDRSFKPLYPESVFFDNCLFNNRFHNENAGWLRVWEFKLLKVCEL